MRRLLPLVALLAASCSYSEETAQIKVTVDGIPAAADHLDVVVTPSDTAAVGKNCSSTLTPAPAANATCYRPTFQPEALAGGTLDLAFASPATTGTANISITAVDRASPLAQGSISNVPLPDPGTLAKVTLH